MERRPWKIIPKEEQRHTNNFKYNKIRVYDKELKLLKLSHIKGLKVQPGIKFVYN